MHISCNLDISVTEWPLKWFTGKIWVGNLLSTYTAAEKVIWLYIVYIVFMEWTFLGWSKSCVFFRIAYHLVSISCNKFYEPHSHRNVCVLGNAVWWSWDRATIHAEIRWRMSASHRWGSCLGHTHDKRQGCNFQILTVIRTHGIAWKNRTRMPLQGNTHQASGILETKVKTISYCPCGNDMQFKSLAMTGPYLSLSYRNYPPSYLCSA